MGGPFSLRNIPPHALHLAQCLSEQTGSSLADVFRQAIVSGLLVEATKSSPLADGTFGELEAALLAKALRRQLASAIDLLIQYDEHPFPLLMPTCERTADGQQRLTQMSQAAEQAEGNPIFEATIGDDLDMLGLGLGLTQMAESSPENGKRGGALLPHVSTERRKRGG
jgi:hypothetical protein